MRAFHRRKPESVGQSPGLLVYVGQDRDFSPAVSCLTFNAAEVSEACRELSALPPEPEEGRVRLINVMGVHEPDLVRRVGEYFGLSPLTLEDVLDTTQRPKAEELDGGLVFLVLKNVDYVAEQYELLEEQVCVVWGPDYVLTFQESVQNLCEPIIQRLRRGRGRIRTSGPGYIVIALLDSIMDRVSVTLGKIAAEAEELEDELAENPDESTLHEIYRLKREILFLRNAVWPMQEVLAQLSGDDVGEFNDACGDYLREVKDHTAKVVDEVKTLHDLLTAMLDLHISLAGMRMNRIIKFLTGIATIFIPLTFLAGVYGMNFKHMPELNWEYGYYASLGLMAVVGVGMAVFFAKRKWF
ncbi:magnesium/cobalt transporter CorA [Desulfovibrio aminophilus]|uniref:magnesium/cobalt transporter CorA n=1 Tax=Desulfovibrio aminophilus TaxID=81425 RepID=UPI00339178C2